MTASLVQLNNADLEALYENGFVGYDPRSYHGEVLYLDYDTGAFADMVVRTGSRVNTAPYSQEKYDAGFYANKKNAYRMVREELDELLESHTPEELAAQAPYEYERYMQRKPLVDAYEKQQAEGRLNTTDGPEEQIFFDYIKEHMLSYYLNVQEDSHLRSLLSHFDRTLGTTTHEVTGERHLLEGTEPLEFFLKWVTFFNNTIAFLEEEKVHKSSDMVRLSPEVRTTVEALLRALDEYNQSMMLSHKPPNFPQFDLMETPLKMLELGYSALTFEKKTVEQPRPDGSVLSEAKWVPIVLKHSEYAELADDAFKSMPAEWQIEVLKKVSK